MRGKIDENQKFSDGYREDITSKKSKAGQFASDYMGIRGGAEVGQTIGRWGGAIAGGAFALKVLMGAAGAAVLGGVWPLIAIPLLTVTAAVVGGAVCGVAGKYAGGAVGMIAGGITGAAVGLYNGLFRRGAYAKEKEEQAPLPLKEAPAASMQHGGPRQGKAQGEGKGEAPSAPSAPSGGAADDKGKPGLARARKLAAEGLGNGSIQKGVLSTPGFGEVGGSGQGFTERVQSGESRETTVGR